MLVLGLRLLGLALDVDALRVPGGHPPNNELTPLLPSREGIGLGENVVHLRIEFTKEKPCRPYRRAQYVRFVVNLLSLTYQCYCSHRIPFYKLFLNNGYVFIVVLNVEHFLIYLVVRPYQAL